MTGYELSPDKLAYLVKVASRHHRKQIAGWLSLSAHTRRGETYFLDSKGAEVPIAIVCRSLQAKHQVQQWAYNLFMNYAHFG